AADLGLASSTKACDVEAVKRYDKARQWLRHDTFECASMLLRGTHAYASPAAVRASYRRVERAHGEGSTSRYHIPYGDFLFRLGLEWPGTYKPDTKTVHFSDLTP